MNVKEREELEAARQAYRDRGEVHPGDLSEAQKRHNAEVVFPQLVREAAAKR
jgi:hypothetical protein